MKRFAMTGVAGYVAPRHLQAIRETGNSLVAATDPHDSVGILDRFFWDVAFFTEYERFERHLEKLRRSGEAVHFLSICSPNHLHDAHIRLALRLGADAVCEKPLVLNPWNLDALQLIEEESGQKAYTVLQLRVHPALRQLHDRLGSIPHRPRVDLTYVTARGPWYRYSWKGTPDRSGGIATNVGIHLFDLLLWLFGSTERCEVHLSEPDRMAGALILERADVRWFLSVRRSDLPSAPDRHHSTYRSISIDGDQVEFSGGFTDLHTRTYQEILAGRGFGIDVARPSVELVHRIRTAPVDRRHLPPHPLAVDAGRGDGDCCP